MNDGVRELKTQKNVDAFLGWYIRSGNGFYYKDKRYTSVLYDKENSFLVFNRNNGDADRVYLENLKGKHFVLDEEHRIGTITGIELFN